MINILKQLSKKFPKSLAKRYDDYVGLMCGKMPKNVSKILLCLDLDQTILPTIKKFKPDVILTHHPFIYGKKREVLKEDINKRNLYYELESLNIPVYSYHTNFDAGNGGMNDALSAKLHLIDVYAPELEPIMRIGYLPSSMDINDFALYAKKELNVDYGLLINEGKTKVKKVGIVGGGGSKDFNVAIEEGCDIYISGDISHRTRRNIILSKFNYLDLPHEIEKIFMPTMKNILLSIDKSLDILIIDHEKEPKVI